MNEQRLRAAITRKYGDTATFARASGKRPEAVERSLKRGNFKVSQIQEFIDLLGLEPEEAHAIFFGGSAR